MNEIDLVRDTFLEVQRAAIEHSSQTIAIASLLMQKGVFTLKEFQDEKARALAMLDQEVAGINGRRG